MKRVITALVLIPLFAYLTIWSPQWLFLAAVAAVALLCFHEFAGLVAHHNIEPPGPFGYVAGLLVLFLPQADQSLFSRPCSRAALCGFAGSRRAIYLRRAALLYPAAKLQLRW